MSLKLSSYLENFQPVIMKFFSLFSFFHFLWDSILIYFSVIKIFSNKCEAQLIFSHSLFIPCLYLTHSIFFSFMTIKVINLGSILMSFPANYVMYFLTLLLLLDFSLIMNIFLLLYTLQFFSF